MAVEKVGNRVYQYITDLPEVEESRDGDKMVVQTTTGTALLDFKNLFISLDQCLFKSSIISLLGSDGNPIINKIGSETLSVENMAQTGSDTLSTAANTLNLNDIKNFNELAEKHNAMANLFMGKFNMLLRKVNEIIDATHSVVTPIPESELVTNSSLSEVLVTKKS